MRDKQKNKNLKSFGVEKPPLSHAQAVECGKAGKIKSDEAKKEKRLLAQILQEEFFDKVANGDMKINNQAISWLELLTYAFEKNPNAFIKNYVEMTEGKESNHIEPIKVVYEFISPKNAGKTSAKTYR
jgi:hypothetical protein